MDNLMDNLVIALAGPSWNLYSVAVYIILLLCCKKIHKSFALFSWFFFYKTWQLSNIGSGLDLDLVSLCYEKSIEHIFYHLLKKM